MSRIAVTGGSGGCGGAAVEELVSHGHEVVNLDLIEPTDGAVPFRQVDLVDYPSVCAALDGCESVAHLAANPNPDFESLLSSARAQALLGFEPRYSWRDEVGVGP